MNKNVKIQGWKITEKLSKYLKERGSTSKTLRSHNKNWQRLYDYAQKEGLSVDFQSIDSVRKLINRYLLSVILSATDLRSVLNSFKILKEFILNGKLKERCQTFDFSGPIGTKMLDLISEKEIQHVSQTTIKIYKTNLSRFLDYLNSQDVRHVYELKKEHVIQYINQLDSEYKSMLYQSVYYTKVFLKWLFHNKLMETDITINIPSPKFVQQPQLPSVYSTEEITKVLNTIDRGNPVGKRNYLCLLLAARLALRSSDIRNLKFSNIFWEENIIRLTQVKTGHPVELPLLPEIGNAIIDYLKYGRPESDSPFIILTSIPPYEPLKPLRMYRITMKAFKRAGISILDRKHGPHALRHSLSSRMLESLTTMPVISEVLGHTNSGSTMFYLRIDTTSLKLCALDAPELKNSFYEQFKW